jgi:hypothetical protein
MITFVMLAVLAECLVVLYAMSIGIVDLSVFKIGGLDISPLFLFVPMAAIVMLVCTWVYFTRKLAARPQEVRRPGPVSSRRTELRKPMARVGRRVDNFFAKAARAPVRSAVTVLLVFLALVLVVSLLAFPQLVYRTLQSAYQNNPSLLYFVQSVGSSVTGFVHAVAPIDWVVSGVNGGLLASAPAVQAIGVGLGNGLAGLAHLDYDGRYLAFQNVAAWVSVALVLFYGEFMLKGYKHKRKL